jgi:hypothetical protein
MNQLNIHDASPETYTALAVEEEGSKQTAWKSIETPTISVVVFRPRPEPTVTERSHA